MIYSLHSLTVNSGVTQKNSQLESVTRKFTVTAAADLELCCSLRWCVGENSQLESISQLKIHLLYSATADIRTWVFEVRL